MLADGLSPIAVMQHALPVLATCLDRLADHRVAPLVVVEQGRVAIGDEIGQIAAASIVVVMVGERPGLSVADSLGLYLTWNPRIGSADAQRNCISNIHADGLSHAQAGHKAAWLIREARRRRLTGVALKDGSDIASIDHGQDDRALTQREPSDGTSIMTSDSASRAGAPARRTPRDRFGARRRAGRTVRPRERR